MYCRKIKKTRVFNWPLYILLVPKCMALPKIFFGWLHYQKARNIGNAGLVSFWHSFISGSLAETYFIFQFYLVGFYDVKILTKAIVGAKFCTDDFFVFWQEKISTGDGLEFFWKCGTLIMNPGFWSNVVQRVSIASRLSVGKKTRKLDRLV